MTWAQLAADYYDYLELRHYAAGTMSIYRLWLGRFTVFCQAHGVSTPAEVAAQHVDSFHHQLLWDRGQQALYLPTTVDQALRALRCWFRWAVGHDRLFADPTRHLVLRRPPRQAPRLLTLREMVRLLDTPDPRTATGLRDQAVLETLYGTGMRRGECCALDVDDVDFSNHVILVRQSKDRRQRLVPLGGHLAVLLQQYLDEARPKLARLPDERALFVSKAGTRYGGMSLLCMVRDMATKAGVGPLNAHAIRHICATHMLQAGADVEDVQKLLGHASIQTTSTYTHVQPGDLRKVHRRTHPKGL